MRVGVREVSCSQVGTIYLELAFPKSGGSRPIGLNQSTRILSMASGLTLHSDMQSPD